MLEKRTVSQCTSSDYCKGWNDAVDEMPMWIDVNERLPDKEGDYLVYIVSCFSEPRMETMYLAKYANGFNWAAHVIGYWVAENTITHWMPLPEPPKEGVNNG